MIVEDKRTWIFHKYANKRVNWIHSSYVPEIVSFPEISSAVLSPAKQLMSAVPDWEF
jgi:hypothetical protein